MVMPKRSSGRALKLLKLMGIVFAGLLVLAVVIATFRYLLLSATVVAAVITWRYFHTPAPRLSFFDAARADIEQFWGRIDPRGKGQPPIPPRPGPATNRRHAEADAAFERGRVGDGLRWYADTGRLNDARMLMLFDQAMPDRQVRGALLYAVTELTRLKASTVTAHELGISPAVVNGIAQDAEQVLTQLWPAANRLAAGLATATENGAQSPSFQQRAAIEVEKLDRLTQATRQAKEGLAIAMLPGSSGFNTEAITNNLQLMGDVARDLDAP